MSCTYSSTNRVGHSWVKPGNDVDSESTFAGQALILLPTCDLFQHGQRALEFVVEEPHRIENFAEGCGCFRPVGLSKGEDAVVAQISHDGRVGNSIAGQVA